jgi:hypothetical protein
MGGRFSLFGHLLSILSSHYVFMMLLAFGTALVLGWPDTNVQDSVALSLQFFIGFKERIAVITAVLGLHEKSVKRHAEQTIDADFIAFADSQNLTNAGNWMLDFVPYHLVSPSPLDDGTLRNSLQSNHHPYMVHKYYKMQFHRIPRLIHYDIIVWIDADLTIEDHDCLEYLRDIFRRHPKKDIIAWNQHPFWNWTIQREVGWARNDPRWRGVTLGSGKQPFQDLQGQLHSYLNDSFRNDFWSNEDLAYRGNITIGFWKGGFLAYRMRSHLVPLFLDGWFLEVLRWTTQDQVSSAYVLQKLGKAPYTLPDARRPWFPRICRWPHGCCQPHKHASGNIIFDHLIKAEKGERCYRLLHA